MKKRLLMLLAAFMAVTSVGWTHADNTVYYTIGSAPGGTGTQGAPITGTSLETLLTAVNANTTADSIVINLPDGEYTVTSGTSFSITKPGVSIIGTDSNKVVIKSPFDITLSQKGNISFASLQIAATTSVGRGLVDIKSSNTTVSFRETKLNIEGAGTGDGGPTVCFGIVSQLDVDNNTVNFIGSHMYMSKGYERGLCFRDGAGHTLNMENSKINGPSGGSGYPYVIGIGAWPGATSETKPVTYNIKNSIVDVNYYAVFTNNQTNIPIIVNIDKSDITGWSSLYVRGDNVSDASFKHSIIIKESTMTGRSFMNGPSDGFGSLVFEVCPDVDLSIDTKSKIIAKHLNPQQVPAIKMDLMDIRKSKINIDFVANGNSKCLMQAFNTAYTPIAFNKKSESNVTINHIENVEILDGSNQGYIKLYSSDGSFDNAVADVTSLLSVIEDGDKVVFPEGTFELPVILQMDKSITIEGASTDKTIIKGHIEVASKENTTTTLTANNLTLIGNNNSATHGVIGMIGKGKDIVKLANCKIDATKNLKGQLAAVGVRMESVGAELTMKDTDIDAYYYGVGVRNKEQKVDITNGTVMGWGAIMTSAGGLTPSDGTLKKTNTSITANGTHFISNVIAQGSSNAYGALILQEKYNGVTANFTNCIIEAGPTRDAALNAKQTTVIDIRSYGNIVAFNKCTLNAEAAENQSGAALIRLGWDGSDDKSTPELNMITITNSHLNGKTDEKLIYSNRGYFTKAKDKLTIDGTVYDERSKLICYAKELTGATFKDAMEAAVNGDTLILPAGKYKVPASVIVNKSIVLDGTFTANDSTIIVYADSWKGSSDSGTKHLISIEADNVALKNIVVDGVGATEGTGSGINVYTATGVTLDNVISRNNKAAGLIVNGSTVTATNFRTSGNAWYGVNVDKGQGVSKEPVFTIGSGCGFAEPIAIKSDDANAPASYVVGNGWFKTTAKDGDKGFSVWINGAASGLNFAITSVPSSVIYGQANLPLLTNVDSAYYKANKVSITVPADNKVVSIKEKTGEAKYDSLQILKPGEVLLSLVVGDTVMTQKLTVLKKTLTITGITTKARNYDGKKDVTLVKTDMEVSGLVGDHTLDAVVTVPDKGEDISANAGVQPVTVTATLNSNGTNYGDYYELAEIIGVTDTIKKVELTVTATVAQTKAQNADTLSVDYGTLPTFGVTYSGFVNSENKDSEGVLKGDVKYNSSATTTSLAGTYSVTPSGLTADNYDIKYVSAPFKIAAKAPTVEMTGIEVVSLGTEGSNNASVKVTGHVTSNGGTKMEALEGDFKVKANGSYASRNLSLKVDKDGMFSATLKGLSQAETHILASAKAGDLVSDDGSGDANAMSVDLNLQLQNVSFASTFKTLTYGVDSISLSAKDFEKEATVVFTSSDASVLDIKDNKMAVKKPGVATITVTATKDGYITAVAKQTITVNKKALAVTPKAITKQYDGTTAVKVEGTLPNLDGLTPATLSSASLDANFASKNVGQEIAVALADEFELSTGSDYYELIQPTNLKGSITSGGQVTVVVSNVSRNHNEKALHYDLAFKVGNKVLESPAYTGTVSVTEPKIGTFQVNAANIKIPNYDEKVAVEPSSGNIDIKKGTPKVLTYNVDQNNIGGLLLDEEGWADAKLRVIGEADGKVHASVYYNEDKDSIVGRSLAKATPPSFDWNFQVPAANSMLRATKAITNASVQYGQTATFSKQTGVSFESSNPNVFVVKEGTGNMIIETVGVGTAAVIAKGSGNNAGVTCLQVEVKPKTIKLQANTITKVYDGTTSVNVTFQPVDLIGATLDLEGVSFNFANSNAGSSIAVTPSKDIVLKNNNEALASAANYTLSIQGLTGSITQRELTFTGTEVNKFYDGTNMATLTDYAATGLIDGEAIPALTATFTTDGSNAAKDVATGLKVVLELKGNSNYSLKNGTTEKNGSIVKSTIDATLPEGASDVDNLIANVALVVRETGTKVTKDVIDYKPTATAEGTGVDAVYYISGGDNDNYSVVYDKNQIGYKATVTPPSGGSDDDATVTISLDATAKTLPRLEEFVLKATVSPAGQTVTWSSSDPTIASVTADGNKATVKALKVGTATITAKIGSVTATCEVTVDFATGLEEALANTQIYAKQGSIYVNPIQPLQLTIVNMLGKIVYNARISSYAQIPVTNGIYIVKLTNAGNTIVTKVNVY